MLLEFGVRNFFSFKEGATISFKLDENCPKQISQGKSFTPVLGIKGANASGKTQILKALPFLAAFCTRSFANEPSESLTISPFFNSTEPIEFFAEFSVDSLVYTYELICTEEAVLSEVIYEKKNRKVKVFERVKNEITFTTTKLKRLAAVKLRQNASIISTAHQYEFTELNSIYEFFNLVVSNVGFGGMREKPIEIGTISELLHSNKDVLSFVSEFIAGCDAGVEAVHVHKATDEDGKDRFFPSFVHPNGDQSHDITQYTESSGTKALYRTLPMYKVVLDHGGVLVLDEFDMHLHPYILPKLLDLFLDKESNSKDAQLLFTTHSSEVFDLLGRYRIYLVNKRNNESFAIRLDEIPGDILRNDRPILPAYRDGKIGGVPRI